MREVDEVQQEGQVSDDLAELGRLLSRVVESKEQSLPGLMREVGLDPSTDLMGEDLRNLDLNEVDLHGADLSGTDLRGTDLRDTDLSGARLAEVNMSGAKLANANLTGADLRHARFDRTDLSGANLDDARLAGVDLRRAVLRNTRLPSPRVAVDDGPIRARAISRRTPDEPQPHLDRRALQSIMTLARRHLKVDACVLWLASGQPHRELSFISADGIAANHPPAVPAADESTIASVLDTTEALLVSRRPGDKGSRQLVGWAAAVCVPVRTSDGVLGLLEILTRRKRRFAGPELDAARLVADACRAVLHSSRAMEEAEIGRACQELNDAPSLAAGLVKVAEAARTLTAAEESRICGLDRDGAEFCIASAGATTRCERDAGRGSTLRVPLHLETGEECVIYVFHEEGNRFAKHHHHLLDRLAARASGDRGSFQRLLRFTSAIDRVAAEVSSLESRARALCGRIMESGAQELCAVQIIRQDRIVETISGEGHAAAWVGLARHRLAEEILLRDIQADIVQRCRAEVISGPTKDPRFDEFLFERYKHEDLVRVFVPLIVLFDDRGGLHSGAYHRLTWEVLQHPEPPHGHIVLAPKAPKDLELKVIGTIEVGRNRGTGPISALDAIELATLDTEHAPMLYRATLEHALKSVVATVAAMSGADSAVLHIKEKKAQNLESPEGGYCYTMTADKLAQKMCDAKDAIGGIGYPPRPNGLGAQALRERRIKVIPDPALGQSVTMLRTSNPTIYGEGVRAMAAVPLLAGDWHGVVYIHYKQRHDFTDKEVARLQLLANRCGEAIRVSLERMEERDRLRQLVAAQRAMQYLMNPLQYGKEDHLRRAIAWYTLNLLAADVVTVYGYDAARKEFETPPVVAGRLRQPDQMETPLSPGDAPWRILAADQPFFAPQVRNDVRLNSRQRPAGGPLESFVDREHIVSSAGLCLGHEGAVNGVLFINFRGHRDFSPAERTAITGLVDVAGMALDIWRGVHARHLDMHQASEKLQRLWEKAPPLASLLTAPNA